MSQLIEKRGDYTALEQHVSIPANFNKIREVKENLATNHTYRKLSHVVLSA
jgi:hypothetical protein